METEHIKADIPAYVNGDLPEASRRRVEGHTAECDSCRHALNKAKSKQARSKRQALKNASKEQVPNLLMARLARQAGLGRTARRSPWGWIMAALVIGITVFAVRRVDFHRLSAMRTVPLPLPPLSTSTMVARGSQTVPRYEVNQSSSNALAHANQEATPPVEEEAPELPQSWSGPDSAVKDFREVVIKGRTSWHTLWEEMGQTGPAPRINFRRSILVGAFAGERPNASYQILLGQPKDLGDEEQIPYRVATTAVSSSSFTAVTHPYALMTIPRLRKAVRLVPES